MNKMTILVTIEFVSIITTLILAVLILSEVKRDQYDVNRDGVANITDLSVLAAELNARSQGQ